MKENKHSAPSLNRGLSSIVWCLRRPNHVTFTEECTEKPCLSKKKKKNGFWWGEFIV